MTGKPYRLLSESEWEYAARAGTQTAYSWGNAVGKDNANCTSCGRTKDRQGTTPTGIFAANPFGLHDMEGNVSEFVEDCVHDNYVGAPEDDAAWHSVGCQLHVRRGGNWLSSPKEIRVAARNQGYNINRGAGIGFRVARTLQR